LVQTVDLDSYDGGGMNLEEFADWIQSKVIPTLNPPKGSKTKTKPEKKPVRNASIGEGSPTILGSEPGVVVPSMGDDDKVGDEVPHKDKLKKKKTSITSRRHLKEIADNLNDRLPHGQFSPILKGFDEAITKVSDEFSILSNIYPDSAPSPRCLNSHGI